MTSQGADITGIQNSLFYFWQRLSAQGKARLKKVYRVKISTSQSRKMTRLSHFVELWCLLSQMFQTKFRPAGSYSAFHVIIWPFCPVVAITSGEHKKRGFLVEELIFFACKPPRNYTWHHNYWPLQNVLLHNVITLSYIILIQRPVATELHFRMAIIYILVFPIKQKTVWTQCEWVACDDKPWALSSFG